jgi:hypothetical protein
MMASAFGSFCPNTAGEIRNKPTTSNKRMVFDMIE